MVLRVTRKRSSETSLRSYTIVGSMKCLAIELSRDIYKKIHLATYEIILMHQHVDDMRCIRMHQSVRFGEIIAPKPRQQQVIGLGGRAMLRGVA